MDRKKLLRLIRLDEGSKLDFKERINLNTDSEKKEFAKDVCAIANSNGKRGYLIVGIKDKSKKIVGVTDDCGLTEEKVQQIITSRCDPPIPISLESIEINRKKVVVITIYDGEQKPYQIRDSGAFYIRRGSTTDVMRKSEILNVFQERLDLNMESCPVINTSERLLDFKLISDYFKTKSIELNEENKDFLLSSSNIIKIDKVTGEKWCTLGGILVFSQLNSLAIPYNMVKIKNENDNFKTLFIQGSLLTIIDKSEAAIKDILPKEYPISAIVEAIKNAVLYRDYTLSNYIEVVIGSKEIVVKNPGNFIENNDNYLLSYSKRNMWIYEKLITLDKLNRFVNDGNGLNRMKETLKKIGKVTVVDCQNEAAVKVIFPGTDSLN